MTRTSLIALGAIAVAACQFTGNAESRDRDPGPQTERNFSVGAFDKIEVAGPYDVKLTTGGATAVSAKGGSALLDETDVVVEGGTLKIMPKKQKGIRWSWRSGKAEFTVSTAALRAAGIAGSGSIDVDKVAGDFKGEIAGSGDLRIAATNGGALNFAIAGSGGITASGTADSVKSEIAGSGDIDAGGVAAKTADVSIAGSGNVRANASETASVSIMGSGDVDIAGGAKCSVSKAGSGNVNCH